METLTIKIMLSTMTVVFMYILLGRLVTSHTTPRQAFLTPLASLLTGLGIWQFWFIGFAGALGVSVDIVIYLFGGAVLLLLVAMFQTFRSFQSVEHFWSKLVMSVVLIGPLWGWLLVDIPHLAQELIGPVNTLQRIFALGHLPNQEEALLYGLEGLTAMPGVWSTLLPISFLAQEPTFASFALVNISVLLAAGGTLVQTAGMQVRWSNLLLISAGCLIGMTLLNPFFNALMVTSALPDVIIAAGLLMLATPLLSQGALPQGIALIPVAFAAVAVASQSEHTWPFLCVLAIFWAVRALFLEQRTIRLRHMFGWVTLGTVPLLAILLWQEYIRRGQLLATPLPAVDVHPWLGQGALLMTLGIMVGAVLHVLKYMQKGQYKALWRYESSWLIAVGMIFVAFVHPNLPFERGLVWGQFLLLLPLWRLWNQYYQTSQWKKMAYRSPWAIGGVLAVVSVGMLLSTGPLWQNKPFMAARHTQLVADVAARNAWIQPGHRVAVWADHTGPRAAMAYAVLPKVATLPAEPAVHAAQGNRAQFHAQLKGQGVSHLWINSPTDEVRDMFRRDLKAENSYLFTVNPHGFKLLHVFPHAAYTGAGWDEF